MIHWILSQNNSIFSDVSNAENKASYEGSGYVGSGIEDPWNNNMGSKHDGSGNERFDSNGKVKNIKLVLTLTLKIGLS